MRVRLKNKKVTLIVCSCLVAVGILIIGISSLIPRNSSSQSDYPTLPQPGAATTVYYTTNMEEAYSFCDLIIQGTVSEVRPPYTKIISPNGAITDKAGSSGTEMTVYEYKLRVDDLLLGQPASDEITLVRGLYADAEPPLAKGDSMIFLLEYHKDKGTYVAVYPHEGYYYIAADNKVYPAEKNTVTARTSGMDLNAFKQEIRDYAKNHPKNSAQ